MAQSLHRSPLLRRHPPPYRLLVLGAPSRVQDGSCTVDEDIPLVQGPFLRGADYRSVGMECFRFVSSVLAFAETDGEHGRRHRLTRLFAHRFMFFCTLWYQDLQGLSPVLATVRFLPSPITGLILNVRLCLRLPSSPLKLAASFLSGHRRRLGVSRSSSIPDCAWSPRDGSCATAVRAAG